MASPEADSRSINTVLIPALEKIISNSSWRKHSKLGNECKSLLERIKSPEKPPPVSPKSPKSPSGKQSDSDSVSVSNTVVTGVLHDTGSNELSLDESEVILSPIIKACSSGDPKIAEPGLDCVQKLIAYGYLRGESDNSGGLDGKLLAKLIESVCKCSELGDEGVELLVLQTILSAV